MHLKILLICLVCQLTLSNAAYRQWVKIIIKNETNDNIYIKSASLKWGKWHYDGSKDHELNTINDMVIRPGKEIRVNSCGREHSPSGCEGNFDLIANDGAFIRNIYFDCPWGSQTNEFVVSGLNQEYIVDHSRPFSSGALGSIDVIVKNKPQESHEREDIK